MFSITLEPEPRLLDQAEPASQERLVCTVRLRLVEVDRRPHDDFYTVIANPRRRPTGRAWGVECAVQLDGRPVGTLDVHATSRGLVGRS